MQIFLQKYNGIYRKICNKDSKTPSLTLRFYLNCLIVLAIIMMLKSSLIELKSLQEVK